MLIAAAAMNIGALRSNGNDWASRAAAERNVLELVAASPAVSTVARDIAPIAPFSPDVRIADIGELVADGAIHPRAASTPAEQALVDTALSQTSP